MNKKELRRFLELTGQVQKNAIVTGLYENYYDSDALDAQGPLKGLEGPFRMKNGRVVYYDTAEGKYYDRRSDMYLSDREAAELHETTQYHQQGVVLHAKRGEEKLTLRLESMIAVRPMATLLRNNGYDDFEYSDGDTDEPVDFELDGGEEEETVADKLARVQHDVEHLQTMLDNGEVSEEDIESLVAHLDAISDVHSQFMGDEDEEGEFDSELPVDDDPEVECGMYERELTDDEKEKLERLKDKHDKDGGMKAAMKKQYGDKWEDVYYGKLTKMAKESVEETEEEVIEEAGRARDTKVTPSLSRSEEKRNKKAMNSKERQQGRKAARMDETEEVNEDAAVNATYYDNQAMPADAVDDMDQKAERTGRADRTGTKNVVPKEVMAAIDRRVSEIKKSIERYDHTGYNDHSVKRNAVECLEQIKKNLSRGDHEGFMEAQVFFGTLMSPIWDLFPAQLVNYLAKGDDSNNPDAA